MLKQVLKSVCYLSSMATIVMSLSVNTFGQAPAMTATATATTANLAALRTALGGLNSQLAGLNAISIPGAYASSQLGTKLYEAAKAQTPEVQGKISAAVNALKENLTFVPKLLENPIIDSHDVAAVVVINLKAIEYLASKGQTCNESISGGKRICVVSDASKAALEKRLAEAGVSTAGDITSFAKAEQLLGALSGEWSKVYFQDLKRDVNYPVVTEVSKQVLANGDNYPAVAAIKYAADEVAANDDNYADGSALMDALLNACSAAL